MLIPKNPYRKRDLFELLQVSETDQRNGNWKTGYIKYSGSYYVFVNIGGAGRTGHDYNNYWDGDKLVWYSKNGSHIGQPIIDEMLSGDVPVHIFTRIKDRDPFIYEGIGIKVSAKEDEGMVSVRVVWDLGLEMTEDEVNTLIGQILDSPEAPDDKELQIAVVLRRARRGQARFKEKLLEVYEGQCCITGCGVRQVLEACHIEAHYLKGNNHSSNALLLRADIHDLFDLNMIAIEPGSLVVHVSPALKDTEYRAFHGTILRARKDHKVPDSRALEERWKRFLEMV